MSTQNSQKERQLVRGLKARHLTMIAIGGSIGTGLFVASGGAIHSAGPGGALLAYGAIGFMVYFLMTSLGEMAAYMPESGSFSTYAARFVDPALGFALGWNYWFNWAITIAAEVSAASLIVKYWLPGSSSLLWSVLFLAIMVGINYFSVRAYGESEYWFSFIKVVTIIIFIVIGLMMIFGFMGGNRIGRERGSCEKCSESGEADFLAHSHFLHLVHPRDRPSDLLSGSASSAIRC
jgi:lysine-specific permease